MSRNLFWAFFVPFLFLGQATLSGEEGKGRNANESFADKLYSLFVPYDWSYRQYDDGQVLIEDQDSSGNYLLILPPNPAIADNPAEFAGYKLGALFGDQGDIGIIEETAFEVNGTGAAQALFAVKNNGKTVFLGMATILYVPHAPVIMIAAESANSDEEFLSALPRMIESYQINDRWLKARQDELAETGQAALADAQAAGGDKAPVIKGKDESGAGVSDAHGADDSGQAAGDDYPGENMISDAM